MLRDLDYAYDVSVIIPHYKTLDLLRAAIDSISSQTIVPREIIVIDDASELQFELPGHCGDNIALRLICETENRGAAWCRNRGIEEATGDIIAFLDADDRWLPDKLERCIAAFGPKPDEHEARVLFSNVLVTDGTRHVLGNHSPYDGQSMLDFILLEGGYIQTSSIMMWRHQYPMISFDESLRRHQDWDFAIKAEMAGCAFVYLHDALVEYYLSSGAARISMVVNCEPSLVFFKKHYDLMSKKHVSAFVFNVLIYKRMDIALRLAIVEKIISKEIEIPSKGWVLLFVRLIVGRGIVDLIKQLWRKIQIRDCST
ncbi:glycosyltransferase family 2 protein [Paraburkholderia dinghuensis]|uniref:Glycosyltransferase family 2 protein n=1 Tax=Paraburkholderia dinghuensis TaxID=2305225 RepID=A0A3N6PW83_9BURK|nr:glycosyltransferase family 2 protein [Paraburkholderia dinghuensis]RQH04126.1 glycosyltransferase family 2 protein [Paraburkholderia dinghuensis]